MKEIRRKLLTNKLIDNSIELSLEDDTMLMTCFYKLAEFCSDVPFDNCAVEVYKDKDNKVHLKITLTCLNEHVLMISKSFYDEVFKDDNIIYSLFIERNMLASDVISVSVFMPMFSKFMKMQFVKHLRLNSGRGMMDCKNFLEETEYNYDEAYKLSKKMHARYI